MHCFELQSLSVCNRGQREFSTRVSFNFSRSTTGYDFVKSRPRLGITKLKLQAFSLAALEMILGDIVVKVSPMIERTSIKIAT